MVKLDPQLQPIVDQMKAILDNLNKMLKILRDGGGSANDLLAMVRRHEAMLREGRASILETRGEAYAALVDPLIERVVECRREVETHVQ